MSELEAENEILRELLWFRHGCPFPALYGDDGEMQCNACGLDFKRDSVNRIKEKFTVMGMEKYMKEMAEKEEEEK